jgi:hypothetical protein
MDRGPAHRHPSGRQPIAQLLERQVRLGRYLSLLNNLSSRGIDLAEKTATDDVRLSNRAMLSCDADCPHVF